MITVARRSWLWSLVVWLCACRLAVRLFYTFGSMTDDGIIVLSLLTYPPTQWCVLGALCAELCTLSLQPERRVRMRLSFPALLAILREGLGLAGFLSVSVAQAAVLVPRPGFIE